MALYPSTVQSAIAVLWARQLQIALRKILVYADVCNRKYEGELKEIGDSVRIQTVADVAIGDYTRNTVVTATTLTTTDIVLVVDQGKTFNFKWDDVDDVQAVKGIMQEAMSRAGYNLRNGVDQFIAATIDASVQASNILTAATSVGTGAGDDDPFEILVDLAAKLDENNVPPDGRWAVVPPWYAGELLKDPRRSSFGTNQNLQAYSEGFMGVDTVSGLRVYRSNNVPNSNGAYDILAGYEDAVTFANQVTKFKSTDAPDGFFSYNLGLMIYGCKTTRPYGLAKIVATQAT